MYDPGLQAWNWVAVVAAVVQLAKGCWFRVGFWLASVGLGGWFRAGFRWNLKFGLCEFQLWCRVGLGGFRARLRLVYLESGARLFHPPPR